MIAAENNNTGGRAKPRRDAIPRRECEVENETSHYWSVLDPLIPTQL
jgi:hypothetical protein